MRLGRKESSGEVQEKLNVTNVFNKAEEVKKSEHNKNLEYNCSKQRCQNYQTALAANIVDIEKLKQLAWNGIPQSSSPSMQTIAATRGNFSSNTCPPTARTRPTRCSGSGRSTS